MTMSRNETTAMARPAEEPTPNDPRMGVLVTVGNFQKWLTDDAARKLMNEISMSLPGGH